MNYFSKGVVEPAIVLPILWTQIFPVPPNKSRLKFPERCYLTLRPFASRKYKTLNI